jgi:hypothetical protein
VNALLLVRLLPLGLAGCAAFAAVEPVACQVVSVVNDACMVLTFLGDDGKVHTVRCTREELTAWGKAVEARHAAP